ncbi:MAG: rbsA3 [Streptomyces oryziradicis]|nr:rbsA3 [Actinacidiphila oryziradicis]
MVKTFPGVRALDGVDLTVRPGEVHCLLGQNGAGKSTLIKVLSGAHRPDAGQITWQGCPVAGNRPQFVIPGSTYCRSVLEGRRLLRSRVLGGVINEYPYVA